MSRTAFALDVSFEAINCCSCGVPFAAPSFFFEKRRDTHEYFYCPNGHSQHFTAKTEAEKLKAELAEEQARHSRTLARLNTSERATKKAERKLKRVARGVCQCCNRTFTNLARHMATQHPEVAPPASGKLV